MPTLLLNQGRSKLWLRDKRKISVRLKFSLEVYVRRSKISEEIVYENLTVKKNNHQGKQGLADSDI